MGYKAVILGFYIFCFSMSYAQKHQFKLGLGNYEGLNIGLRHSFSKFDIEYGLGQTSMFLSKDITIMCMH